MQMLFLSQTQVFKDWSHQKPLLVSPNGWRKSLVLEATLWNVFPIRFKADDGTTITRQHPFALLNSHVEQLLEEDWSYFEVHCEPVNENTVASSFVNSPHYQRHPLVQSCTPVGETVVPVTMCEDGIAIGSSKFPDTLYVIYLTFTHRHMEENAKPLTKHTYTVYRKSQMSAEPRDDIVGVLLWELRALVEGRRPQKHQQVKPVSEQEPGDYVEGNWGR